MNEQFVEDTDNIEPVYHEQKLFCVNNQMVIDCECQEHPIRCCARNIARKFYNPEFPHQDDKKKEYGISRTDYFAWHQTKRNQQTFVTFMLSM